MENLPNRAAGTCGRALSTGKPCPDHPAPAGPVVWILSHGEMHEGGNIDGIYLDRDLARGDFITKATEMTRVFDLDDAQQDADGSIRLAMGCDWLALEPHTVVTRPQID